ncbi:MAG: transcriptional repressor [bacterium]
MQTTNLSELITKSGLKVTPQRIAILDAVIKLKNHPTAENVIDYIKSAYPNIAIGTVYNILETLVDKKLIKKVKTEKDIMRYDAVLEKHHHLYCSQTQRIEDLYDDNLTKLLEDYFNYNKIPNFSIEDIKLNIIGHFEDAEEIINNKL